MSVQDVDESQTQSLMKKDAAQVSTSLLRPVSGTVSASARYSPNRTILTEKQKQVLNDSEDEDQF